MNGSAARNTLAGTASSASRAQTALLWAATAAVLATALWVLAFAGRLLVADVGITEARRQVLQCDTESASWTAAQWQTLQDDLLWGLSVTPADAVKFDLLAQLQACHGAQRWGDEAQRRFFYGQARLAAEASLRLRPGHAGTLTRLAVAIQASGGTQADIDTVWADALRQGPHVQTNHPALAYVALMSGEAATPAMRDWLRGLALGLEVGDRQWLLDLAERLGRRDALP